MTDPHRITIVGGGFSGASAAVQLVRRSQAPLAVTLIEPRAEVGPGLAYSNRDLDHRLNAPMANHSIDPRDETHFARWCEAESLFEDDPEAVTADGKAFVRRGDYGRYLAASVREHSVWPATGSTITHLRATASSAELAADSIVVRTDGGVVLAPDMLIVATGNASMRRSAAFGPAAVEAPALVLDPLQPGRLQGIEPTARVLVVGSGLTALDVLSTLLRNGHRSGIVAVSRHGLRPRPHADASGSPGLTAAAAPARPLDRILGPVPASLLAGDAVPTVRRLTRSLRAGIRRLQAEGQGWQVGFDELREVVWQVWPRLSVAEKRRFLQRLRPWYDAHRFRAPPQNDRVVRAAEAEGRVEFRRARLLTLAPVAGGKTLQVELRFAGQLGVVNEVFDHVVNCTGFDAASTVQDNPFLASLLEQGCLQADPCGLGFRVDANCCAIDASGHLQPRLRVVGPPTAGAFGDPLGVVFIAAQIHRMLPDALGTLAQNFSSKLRNSSSQLQAPEG